MKTLSTIARWCGHLWMGLFVLVFLLAIVGTFLTEPSLATGWRKFTERFDPRSIPNVIVTMVLIAPGLLLYRASDSLNARAERQPPAADDPPLHP